MKRQTTANTATPVVEIEHERAANDNWVASFDSEVKPVAPARPKRSRRQIPLVVAGVCGSLIAGWFFWQTWTGTPAPTAAPLTTVALSGTADFKSVPDSASITIDGTLRGVTPLRVSLAPGTYNVEITSGSTSRTLPITIEAGSVVSQYVELAGATVTMGGRLEIGSDQPGAQVALDGARKGVTPLVLNNVTAGQHRVTVSAGENTVSRNVTVTRGATVALVISTEPVTAKSAGGWLTIQAPVDMEILEDGRVLGTTRMERLMLPVGSHRIELANAALEFTIARTVQVAAGKTANVAISLPSGKLAVNAVPWADVFMDGASLGTTPLGELAVPIGTHELVFRHPQLGERRQAVTVKAQTPTRIGVDLRK
jgi:PEGA domain